MFAADRSKIYIEEKKNRESGGLNGIPLYYSFPKLGGIIKTIPRGYSVLLTANSGVGKTQSWIGIFIYNIYKLKKEHPELKFKAKILIALLEDTKEMFIDRLYSMLFMELFGIVVDNDTLHSRNESGLSEDLIDKLPIIEKEIDDLLQDCEIVDSIYNPTGLYKWLRTISNKIGVHHTKKVEFTNEDGSKEVRDIYSHFTPNDEELQVFVVVDNLNNFSEEAGLNERQTINRWTRSYVRLQITKHWGWSVLNIIQQSADSEKQQFTVRGESIVERVKPSLDGLGNSKECQRDHLLILGIFAPNRYGIETYGGYDIKRYGDNFRSIIILKSNMSPTNIEIPMYFNGACSQLRELPKPQSIRYDDTFDKLNDILNNGTNKT